MNEMIFSWAEDANGKMVHVDSVPQGLNCGCTCPCCHERLQARHGAIRAHGFAHHSENRGANLKICYMVIMYKLAEQIIQQEKKIHVPSYYGIFKDKDISFSEVIIDDRYDRIDKQPDVIAITPDGKQYLIEFTFAYKVQHMEKIDYQNLNCLEVDLSSQTLESLRDFILYSSENKKWLNNQLYFEQIEELYSKHGKLVKVTDENDCVKCRLNTDCCGIRMKGCQTPIIIENSGKSYRVCKIEEFDRAQKQLEERELKESYWNRFYEKERQFFFGMNSENDKTEYTMDEETLNKHREHESLELTETAKITPEQRTCFMCRSNLDWMCRDDGYAHCGPYATMGVSKNTPPDSAKTCRGFRIKLNRK